MITRIADLFYDRLIGESEGNESTLVIENMFDRGEICSELYNDVYEANICLCDRLGVQEDADVELIINSLLRISRLLGRKMFQYGMKYQSGGGISGNS